MATRLRSDKGSFVRSPKGAFETEAGAPALGVAQVQDLLTDVSNAAVYVPPPTCGVSGIAGNHDVPGYTRIGWDWQGPIIYDPAQFNTFFIVGRQSGAVYNGASLSLTFECANTGTPQEVYTGTEFVPVSNPSFPDRRVYEYATTYRQRAFDLNVEFVTIHISTGQYPGAIVPAFIFGELCDVYATLP